MLTRPRRLPASLLAATRAATRRLRWVTHRLGYRGAALGWFATYNAISALSLLDPRLRAVLAASPTFRVIAQIDLRIWGIVWLAVGLLCFVQAWMLNDRWAFFAQMWLLWIWAALTFATLWDAPTAVRGGTFYATFGGFVLVISGWPEPPRPFGE